MKVTPIKTKVAVVGDKLFDILDSSIKSLKENSVVVVTSKIVSICEGNVIKIGKVDKEKLIKSESELYLPPNNKYKISLSIRDNIFIPSAGIDESNGNGYYILWPKNSQKSAGKIRKYLIKKFNLKHLGVIITDSKTTPLRWGVTGVAVSHSGFSALNDYIGTPDIFGYPLRVTKANVGDALAAASVLVMGEGKEQTPICVIEDLPFVQFQSRNPSKKELKMLAISIEDDLYSTMIKGIKWQKGGKKKA
jgi:dihydrofolate synthase / folylpolyglutamate synthase